MLPDRPLRRQPYPHEIAAATDFAAIDVAYEEAAERLHRRFLDEWLPAQLTVLEAQILASESRDALAAITAPVIGAGNLTDELVALAQEGQAQALAEIGAQGLNADGLDADALRSEVADHAAAVARQVASGISLAASRRAVQLAAERSPQEIATGVREYMGGLTHQWEAAQLQGAVGQALGAGRMAVFQQVESAARFYLSALLDAASCPPCVADDGMEFASLAEMRRKMPSGGNEACEGGPRCRCIGIAVYGES